jgi:hypothetical protein
VYLVSAGGQPNFGDEFITRAWLDYLAVTHPELDVWLDCPEPGRAAHLFRDAHPRLHTTNTLWQLGNEIEQSAPVTARAAHIQHFITELGSPRIDQGLSFLRTVRSIHLLGGGYISSRWPSHLSLVMGMVAVRRRFDVPIFATGQGWLPQDEDVADWLSSVVKDFNLAEARDEQTAARLGLARGWDDAYLALSLPRGLHLAEEAPESIILLQGDMRDQLNRAAALKMVDRILEQVEGRTLGVVEAIPGEDAWLWPEIGTRRPDTEFYSFGRVWDAGFPARPGQTWFTTRFHAHLIAASVGSAGVAAVVDPDYYDIKHNLLIDNGTGWTVASPADFEDHQVEPGLNATFPDRAAGFGNSKRKLADQLYASA